MSDWGSGEGRRVTAVHFITITYNGADHIDRFLDCLAVQTDPDWRLTVIDNASIDSSADIVARHTDPRIALVRNPENIGFARASNQGIRRAAAAGAEFFIIINNDTEFAPDMLTRLLAARISAGAEVITPRIMLRDAPDKAWYVGGYLENSWVLHNVHEVEETPDPPALRKVSFASGCCLGVSRAAFERAGLFDETFFVYWEDTELCMRFAAHGIDMIYARDPVLFHAASSASGGHDTPRYIALYYRSYMQFLRKSFGNLYTLRAMARLLLRELRRDGGGRVRKSALMTIAMTRGLFAPVGADGRL